MKHQEQRYVTFVADGITDEQLEKIQEGFLAETMFDADKDIKNPAVICGL
jgi:hypothetical protein